ncbi:MAG TPA: hypothetical protein VN617_11810 [Rhodoferax sp.]|nr:hypothetical protein [Rhodoferax sp.]
MHTDKEMPTGDGNPTAGHTDSVIIGAAEKTGNPEKSFATLRAQYAMRGHSLHRTDPSDGAVTYWAERWGLVRYLPTLHDAALFLTQIGGGHDL